MEQETVILPKQLAKTEHVLSTITNTNSELIELINRFPIDTE